MKHIFFLGGSWLLKPPSRPIPPALHGAPHWGQGARVGKLLGEAGGGGVEAGLIGKKSQGEVGIQLWIQLYIVFFPPHLKVFTEQAGHEQDMLLEARGGK